MKTLHLVLRVNAMSCLIFGLLFSIFTKEVSLFLGQMPTLIIFLIGIGLVFNGIHLLYVSFKEKPGNLEVLWFSFGDLTWWLGSFLVMLANVWITTFLGNLFTGIIAIFVVSLGLIQLWLIGRNRANLESLAFLRQIGNSWMALPFWVKLWLFALNIIFLLSLIFIPSEIVRIIILSYIVSGPLLLAFVFFEGGFSRIIGVGHLLPWIPMLVWLYPFLRKVNLSFYELIYLYTFMSMTIICLGFDIYDVLRWIKGDRNILEKN